ncbi:MAG: hypothetical protein LBQ83_05755 [Candidatus Margulisbacteria bacterium]|jgi:hypothetical protein|nr:hypothetical protein [Candidatus Margulisiibacteriota bacterium]
MTAAGITAALMAGGRTAAGAAVTAGHLTGFTSAGIAAGASALRTAPARTPRMIRRVVDDLPDFFQMPALEFGGQAGDILIPVKFVAIAVAHQTSGRGPQIGELRGFHFLAGREAGQTVRQSGGHAPDNPLSLNAVTVLVYGICDKVIQRLVVVTGSGFFAG